MPFKLGPLEIVVILVIVLMVFGVGKLPQIASSIGKSLKSFREGQQGLDEEGEAPNKPFKRKKASRRTKTNAAAENTADTQQAETNEKAPSQPPKRKKAGKRAKSTEKASETKPESENVTAG
jgi:sec-independent protein translocase protein TatA